ncbi:MAG: DUF3501 family protein [Gammaproteobacteria bacterium]|nr:DUF3501 family protein [Gammaproteobacteria bacterium]
MKHLTRDDLYSLEKYAQQRIQMRAQVLEHKKNRHVEIGPHATLYFEDRLTMHYQIQEMLRVERVYEAEGIQDELNAYNPMIPDGTNLKATFMLEYPDETERRVALAGLKGVEHRVWIKVQGHAPVWAIADEDLERENDEKTSSVHFLRFEFTAPMIAAAQQGGALSVGIDHAAYQHTVEPLPVAVRAALVADFD